LFLVFLVLEDVVVAAMARARDGDTVRLRERERVCVAQWSEE